MKTILTISLAGLFLAGCASTRPILDVAAAGGGAAIANELSDGDPAITAAGAAGGVLLSEGLHYAARRQSEKAYHIALTLLTFTVALTGRAQWVVYDPSVHTDQILNQVEDVAKFVEKINIQV